MQKFNIKKTQLAIEIEFMGATLTLSVPELNIVSSNVGVNIEVVADNSTNGNPLQGMLGHLSEESIERLRAMSRNHGRRNAYDFSREGITITGDKPFDRDATHESPACDAEDVEYNIIRSCLLDFFKEEDIKDVESKKFETLIEEIKGRLGSVSETGTEEQYKEKVSVYLREAYENMRNVIDNITSIALSPDIFEDYHAGFNHGHLVGARIGKIMGKYLANNDLPMDTFFVNYENNKELVMNFIASHKDTPLGDLEELTLKFIEDNKEALLGEAKAQPVSEESIGEAEKESREVQPVDIKDLTSSKIIVALTDAISMKRDLFRSVVDLVESQVTEINKTEFGAEATSLVEKAKKFYSKVKEGKSTEAKFLSFLKKGLRDYCVGEAQPVGDESIKVAEKKTRQMTLSENICSIVEVHLMEHKDKMDVLKSILTDRKEALDKANPYFMLNQLTNEIIGMKDVDLVEFETSTTKRINEVIVHVIIDLVVCGVDQKLLTKEARLVISEFVGRHISILVLGDTVELSLVGKDISRFLASDPEIDLPKLVSKFRTNRNLKVLRDRNKK